MGRSVGSRRLNSLESIRIRLEGRLEVVENRIKHLHERADWLDDFRSIDGVLNETEPGYVSARKAVIALRHTEPQLLGVLQAVDEAQTRYEQAIWRRLSLLRYQRMPLDEALRIVEGEPILAGDRLHWSVGVTGRQQTIALTSRRLIVESDSVAVSDIRSVTFRKSLWALFLGAMGLSRSLQIKMIVNARNSAGFEQTLIDMPAQVTQALRTRGIHVISK